MDSQHPAVCPASPSIGLPREIIFDILDEYLNLPAPKPIFPVLVISKWSYNRILPKLYHTLSTIRVEYLQPGRVVLDEVLRCASTPSLGLVRHLDCRYITPILTLSSFPNVTHLFLLFSCGPEWWDSQCLAVTLALGADSRIALVLKHLRYFETCGRAFWSAHTAMWGEVRKYISQNPTLHEVTIIDSLSTKS
ncbi:hypothetical protein DL96DRAFT_1821532 [Flagelloscypha sp. PMI_526]|nr:hypothetical protein DL96DRAFT_1821532 [Flagelloscypha sp. PMI_526]